MKLTYDCKGCSASVRKTFEEVKAQMEEYVATIPFDERVEGNIYDERLMKCSSCTGLYYGTTCRHCGCFVQMRAMRKNKGCPNPEGDRWNNSGI